MGIFHSRRNRSSPRRGASAGIKSLEGDDLSSGPPTRGSKSERHTKYIEGKAKPRIGGPRGRGPSSDLNHALAQKNFERRLILRGVQASLEAVSERDHAIDTILQIAIEELHEAQPRDSISLRKIAKRAGVSVGTIGYYFDNKDGLLRACLREHESKLRTRAFQVIAEATKLPAREAVENAVRNLFRLLHDEAVFVDLRSLLDQRGGDLAFVLREEYFQTVSAAAAAALQYLPISPAQMAMTIDTLCTMAVRLAVMPQTDRETLFGTSDDSALEDLLVLTAMRLTAPNEDFRTALSEEPEE